MILSAFTLAASVSMVTCNELDFAPDIDFNSDRWEDWQQLACTHLEGKGENIVLIVKSEKNKKLKGTNAQGGFEIDALKAGRLPLIWRGYEQDRLIERVLWLDVVIEKPTWVLKKRVKAGEKIDRWDVKSKRMNIAPYIGVTELVDRSPVGQRLKKSLAAGTVLKEDMLLPAPIVKRGSKVTVVVQNGGINITTSGTLMADLLSLESKAYVKLDGSDKTVSGQYEKHNTIKVVL